MRPPFEEGNRPPPPEESGGASHPAAPKITHHQQADPGADCTASTAASLRCSPLAGDDLPRLNPPTCEEQLHAEIWRTVERVIHRAVAVHGPLPPIDSPKWWTVADQLRVPFLVACGAAWLSHDCHEEAARQMKAASVAISQALNWTAEAKRESFVELQHRRGLEFDPEVKRWVPAGHAEVPE